MQEISPNVTPHAMGRDQLHNNSDKADKNMTQDAAGRQASGQAGTQASGTKAEGRQAVAKKPTKTKPREKHTSQA